MYSIKHMMMSVVDHRALSGERQVVILRCGRRVFGYVLAATLLMGAAPAGAVESSAQTNLEQWLLRRLNEPTEHERAHERAGKVYIYDGLSDRDVDQALNAHFGRIENMMFLGTVKTYSTGAVRNNESGNVETESPGCQ